MNAAAPKFPNPPIVEAVLDIDCDMPPGFDLDAIEDAARERLREQYPKSRKQFLHELGVEVEAGKSTKTSIRQAVQAFQFLHDDERQLVQVRGQGFSFNRLAPYSSLDDYLPEIERTWRLYTDIAKPVETQIVRLRYINRILLPMAENKVDLDEFLTIGPRLADEKALDLTGFFVQQAAVEKETGHHLNMVLTAQNPEYGKLPVILDIGVVQPLRADPGDWAAIRRTVDSLRGLKNRVFLNTVTEKCEQLFQ